MVIPESGWACVPMCGGECHMGSARVPGGREQVSVYVRGLKQKGGWDAGGRRRPGTSDAAGDLGQQWSDGRFFAGLE